MLELRNLTKRYSSIPVVDGVSFTARPGEVTGYLGPNGSGKSTTLKMITGLIEPSDGEVLFDGEPIERDLIAHRQRFGYVPEEPELYPHLTGAEYLEMVGQLRELPSKPLSEKIDGLLNLFSLYGTGTSQSPPTRKACGRRCCCQRHCSTIQTSCCSTSRSPVSTSAPCWYCAISSANWRPTARWCC